MNVSSQIGTKIMCTTSMVYDYGYHHKPWENPDPWPTPAVPYAPQPLPDRQAADAIKKFLELLETAKKYDASTNQPDCEDPKKSAFMQEVLDRLAAIEKRLAQADK